jgi:hypothetical protein
MIDNMLTQIQDSDSFNFFFKMKFMVRKSINLYNYCMFVVYSTQTL